MCDDACWSSGSASLLEGDNAPPLPSAAARGVKLIVLGDVAVGKSCLCKRIIDGAFSPEHVSTIGAAFASLMLPLDPPVEANLWDTAGEERFRSMTRFYFRGTDCALAVYDVTRPESLEHLTDWIADLRASAPLAKVVVVGNKMDLLSSNNNSSSGGGSSSRSDNLFGSCSAAQDVGTQAATKLRADAFRLVSARSGDGVQEAFLQAGLLATASGLGSTSGAAVAGQDSQ